MTVVGYRRSDFRGSDGHMVEGYRVYLSYEISPNQGAGLATDYVYMTTARLANMALTLSLCWDAIFMSIIPRAARSVTSCWTLNAWAEG